MTWAPVRVGCSVFLNNRYYDPGLGQFTSVDPLVGKTGTPYLYGAGNPPTLSDPSGLCPKAGPYSNREKCLDWIFTTYQVERETETVIYKPSCWFCLKRLGRWTGQFDDDPVNEAEAGVLERFDSDKMFAIKDIRAEALRASTTYADEHGIDTRGTTADAIRHAYLSALLTRRLGIVDAEDLTTAHEMNRGNLAADEAMDLYNNEQGRILALKAGDVGDDELLQMVILEAQSGRLVVIVDENSLVWSSEANGRYLDRPTTPTSGGGDPYRVDNYFCTKNPPHPC